MALHPGPVATQLRELREIGLSSWYVERLHPTERDRDEFHVSLLRLPRDVDARTAALDGELLPAGERPDWLRSTREDRLTAELARQAAREARLRAKLQRARRRGEAARAELERLRSTPGVRRIAGVVRRVTGRSGRPSS